jgi:hypothetical protein
VVRFRPLARQARLRAVFAQRADCGGGYTQPDGGRIVVNPAPRKGDVIAEIDGVTLSAECKGDVINKLRPGIAPLQRALRNRRSADGESFAGAADCGRAEDDQHAEAGAAARSPLRGRGDRNRTRRSTRRLPRQTAPSIVSLERSRTLRQDGSRRSSAHGRAETPPQSAAYPQIGTWTGDHALLCQGITLLRIVEPKAAPEPLSIKPRA